MAKMDLQKTIDELYSKNEETGEESHNIRMEVAKLTAQEICSGKLLLVQVIEALESKLTSKIVGDRVLGMDFLSKILQNLPTYFLNEKELSFLVDFLVDRLKDQHLVLPKVILCIESIVRYKNLPKNSISKLFIQLFHEANIQSHIHKTRRAFFGTLEYVLLNHIEELKSNEVDLIPNFLQSMDGEKDPRNLLILFNMIPHIIGHFPIDLYVEDFFDILSCYFPVDFNPNPVMTAELERGITRKDLAYSLHNCLSATNQFAEYFIPLALEKLDSSFLDAKLDTLFLLKLCCDRCYTPNNLQPHISSLWHGLRREIFMGGNEAVEQAGFDLITSAFVVLSGDEKLLNSSIQLIFSECKHHLSEPELKLSQPASKILLAITKSTPKACSLAISIVMPLLYQQFLTKRSAPERRGILPIMSELLRSIHEFPNLNLTETLEKWDEILAMWFTLLGDSSEDFICLGLQFFANFINTKDITNLDLDINSKSRDLLLCHVKSLLERICFPSPKIEQAIIEVLVNLARNFHTEIMQSVIPFLFTLCKLEDKDPEFEYENAVEFYYKCLQELSTFYTLACSIFTKLIDTAIKVQSPSSKFLLLSTISSMILNAQTVKSESEHEEDDFISLVSSRLSEIIKLALDARKNDQEKEYEIACQIVRDFMRRLSESKQQEIVNSYWNEKLEKEHDNTSTLFFVPGLLGESLLGSLYGSVIFNKKAHLQKILLDKIIKSVNEKKLCALSPDVHADIRLYSVLLNKSLNEESLAELEKLSDLKTIPILLLTVTKALAMRGYGNLDNWIDKIIGILSDPIAGKVVAHNFSILVAEDIYTLNQKSHCVYRFLYKQRIFQLSVPKLVKSFQQSSDGETKGNYVYALSIQLKHVPQVVLQMELKNVLPLLIASLRFESIQSENYNEIIESNAPKAPILESTLFALKELFETSSSASGNEKDGNFSIIIEYLDDIIPRLIRLTVFKGFMDIRILALKCLQLCARVKIPTIVNLQNQVVNELQRCLDDPKRLVRKEAAFTRNIWILINSPGGI